MGYQHIISLCILLPVYASVSPPIQLGALRYWHRPPAEFRGINVEVWVTIYFICRKERASHRRPMCIPWGARGVSMGHKWGVYTVSIGSPQSVCAVSVGSPWGVRGVRGVPIGCTWVVREVSKGCPIGVHGVSKGVLGYLWGIPWTPYGYPMDTSWATQECSVGRHWVLPAQFMGCMGVSMGRPWGVRGAHRGCSPMSFQWVVCRFSVKCPWIIRRSPIVSP